MRHRPKNGPVRSDHRAIEEADRPLLVRRTAPIESRRGSKRYRGGDQDPESKTFYRRLP
jgi:hypothetical protein